MDLTKFAVKRVIVWLIAGILVGGLAADLWWRQRSANVERELAEERQRASETQSKLAGAEAGVKRLADELKTERQRREQLERLVSEGRK
jgi:Tfp pilus assembly protein PilO